MVVQVLDGALLGHNALLAAGGGGRWRGRVRARAGESRSGATRASTAGAEQEQGENPATHKQPSPATKAHLDKEAEHGDHGEAAVLQLLDLQLREGVGVVSQAQGVEGLTCGGGAREGQVERG